LARAPGRRIRYGLLHSPRGALWARLGSGCFGFWADGATPKVKACALKGDARAGACLDAYSSGTSKSEVGPLQVPTATTDFRMVRNGPIALGEIADELLVSQGSSLLAHSWPMGRVNTSDVMRDKHD
jgi:hypothetical protein